jgi:uncharacterized protein with ParB-like and HNH nuclease domain
MVMAKNKLEDLNEVFTNRLFRIPDYQRGYAWEAKKQLKDFWDDLVNMPEGKTHYTGMLSIKAVTKDEWQTWNNEAWLIEGKRYTPFYVVDGQQRLTTFVIFIQSLVNLIRQLPDNRDKKNDEIDVGAFSLEEVTEKYIVESKRKDIIKAFKFGYAVDNPSFLFLRHKIFGEPFAGSINETFYTLNLENAKIFFDNNLQDYFNDYGLNGLIKLFDKATHRMMFNIYEIDDDFDVFVAFETMNNRGKKLSNLELLKSRLIYLTTLFENEQIDDDERIEVQRVINDAWKEVYYQLGRNKQYPLSDDELLRAHWILRYPFSSKLGEDYASFLLNKKFTTKNVYKIVKNDMENLYETEIISDQEIIDEDNGQNEEVEVKSDSLTPQYLKNYADSLKESSKFWYISNFPYESKEVSDQEKLWLDRLNRVGIAYFRPLVVASFMVEGSNEEDRLKLFQEIERFIFIAFRISGAYATYNQNQINRMVRFVYNGEMKINEVTKDIRSRIENWVHPSQNFNYNPFKQKLQRFFQDGGGYFYWGSLRYFLFEFEKEMVLQKGNPQKAIDYFVKGEKDKVSIEHILPQKPDNDYWTNQLKGYSEEEIVFLSGSLGNLLPLSMSVNSSLQNDSFPDKKNNKYSSKEVLIRRGYSDGSHSEVEVSKCEDWNAECILNRGLNLLRFMERRWDIHFQNEEAMKDLLFLDFVANRIKND